MEHIYLDHAATTPIAKEVWDAMQTAAFDAFGNPSSIHAFGRRARKALDEARASIAKSIHAKEKEIIFTSGGTEADNMAIIGTALRNKANGQHVITTAQEHHAVLHATAYLEQIGFDVTYLQPNADGVVAAEAVAAALRPDTVLVSVMFANNETGILQPIQAIGDLLKDHQAYFHVDAVQAFGTVDIDVLDLGIDLLAVSGHKISGPKGVGFLYAKENVPMEPLLYGGEQERKRRAGTENTPGIVGLQKAIELIVVNREAKRVLYADYKQAFLQTLDEAGVQYQVNGKLAETIPSTVNLSFPGTNVEQLLMNFDLAGVAAASGSACTAGSHEPSHVLVAMYGEADERTLNSVRFSFGPHNTKEQCVDAATRIAKIIKRLV